MGYNFLFLEACLRFQIEQGDFFNVDVKRNQKSQGKINVMENIDYCMCLKAMKQ